MWETSHGLIYITLPTGHSCLSEKAGEIQANYVIYRDDQSQRIQKAAQEYTAKWNRETSVNWDLLITVALATALRRSELMNCNWADVDFDAQTIEVNSKENTRDTWEWRIKDAHHRTLPLTEEIVQMLVDHQAQQPEKYPYVFVPTARYDHI